MTCQSAKGGLSRAGDTGKTSLPYPYPGMLGQILRSLSRGQEDPIRNQSSEQGRLSSAEPTRWKATPLGIGFLC